jgi:N-acetylgalactosamine-6-sulfatase
MHNTTTIEAWRTSPREKHEMSESKSMRSSTWILAFSVKCILSCVFMISHPKLTGIAIAADRPNIVVILADDLGYGGLSCYGQSRYSTPNLDRMASEGARLTHFNCPASFCAPTRASLLTGRYPFRCGMTSNPAPDGGEKAHRIHLPESELLLPQLLKQAGYSTGMIGKWHLGHAEPSWLPTQRGFDSYFGIPYSNDMRPVALYEGDQQVEYPIVQANLTRRYTERALAFIDQHRHSPFFLYLAHAMPHKPLAASEAFYKKSGAGLYADTVIELDWSIGQVLAQLKEAKLDEKTLVIFASDNGATFGGSTAGLRGMKGSSYEGGYRVPMIARWPGCIPAGHTSAEHAVMMDVFATVLNVANVPTPAELVIDGRNIMPLFTSDAKSPHEAIFGHKQSQLAVIRDARWKLHVLAPGIGLATVYKPGEKYIDPRGPDGVTILAPYEQSEPSEHPGVQTGVPPKSMQLFDLQNDPSEQTDVANENPDIVARLKAAYDRINREVPLEKPKP